MKKVLIGCSVVLTTLGLTACKKDRVAPATTDKNQLVVGIVNSEFSGYFIDSYFGSNSAYDAQVRGLTQNKGAGVLHWDLEKATDDAPKNVINTNVVKNDPYATRVYVNDETRADHKSATYTINLNFEGYKFPDGTDVTLADYYFGAIYQSSNAYLLAGANANLAGQTYLGYKDWVKGCYIYRTTDGTESGTEITYTDSGAHSAKGSEVYYLPADVEEAKQSSQKWTAYSSEGSKGNVKFGETTYHADVKCSTNASNNKKPSLWGVQLADSSDLTAQQGIIKITLNSNYSDGYYVKDYIGFSPVNAKKLAETETSVQAINKLFATERNADTLVWGNKAFGDKVKSSFEGNTRDLFTGPYNFVEWNTQSSFVQVELNPNYAGNRRGTKPSIEKIILKKVPQATDVDLLANGDINLLVGVAEGDKINELNRIQNLNASTYYRSGYGHLSFHNDFGPTQHVNVRRAMAHMINRQAFIDNFTGGNAIIVNGPYSKSQWMYGAAGESFFAGLNQYEYSIDKANEELALSPYKYESDGTTLFDPKKASKNYVRHNNLGHKLELKWTASTSDYTELLKVEVFSGCEKTGVAVQMEEVQSSQVFAKYGLGDPSKVEESTRSHMFNLASNFANLFVPSSNWHSKFFKMSQNNHKVNDPELDKIMEALESASNDEAFLEQWKLYVKRHNDQMYQIPLYQNSYISYSSIFVKNLKMTSTYAYYDSIVDAHVEVTK